MNQPNHLIIEQGIYLMVYCHIYIMPCHTLPIMDNTFFTMSILHGVKTSHLVS